jgi:hypothetical protein
MRAGADDVESLRKRRADRSGAFQDGAESIDLGGGPMGEVGKGAVADLAIETKGLAEEDSGRGVAVRDGGDVHAYIISHIYSNNKHYYSTYMTTLIKAKRSTASKTNDFNVLGLGTSA